MINSRTATAPLLQPSAVSGVRPLLEIKNLRVQFRTPDGLVDAIDGIDLQVERGEIVALVGESGSGKSMTALSIAGLLPPAARLVSGSVLLDGVDLLRLPEREMNQVRGAKVAMLFQQPKASLDPTSSVGDQVGEALRFHSGLSAKAAWQRSVELLADVGISEPERRAHAFAHQLSGGMAQRVMIATAISARPQLLIADEPTTALDVTVQAQILRLLTKTTREAGLSMVLITHDLGIVATVADRVAVMYAGRIVEDGPTSQIINEPRHPYTEALLRSSLLIPDRDGRLFTIPGGMPKPGEVTTGCRFRSRCVYCEPLGLSMHCESLEPELKTCGPADHEARCWGVESGVIRIKTPETQNGA